MHIHFQNVRSISDGDIEIEKGKLNIFYGPNGIGKSTMIESVDLAVKGELASEKSFVPFFSDKTPEVYFADDKPNQVLIYNQDYISNCLFQENDCLHGTFNLLFKTKEIDEAAKNINALIDNIKQLANGPEVTKFVSDIQAVTEKSFTFAKPGKDGSVHFKAQSDAKFLEESIDKEVNLPANLSGYSPYSKILSWIDWIGVGISIMDASHQDACPFCTDPIDETKKALIKSIPSLGLSKEFQNNKNAREKLISFSNYLDSKNKKDLSNFITDSRGLKDVDVSNLQPIFEKAKFEISKINEIKSLNPISLSQLGDQLTAEKISSLKIDISVFDATKASFISELSSINSELTKLVSKIEELRSTVSLFNVKKKNAITACQESINDFLRISGIPYEVKIETANNSTVTTTLQCVSKAKGDVINISDVKHTLSYGECNAICLAFFAVEASESDGLIVFDDPVSSYDANKRLAILLTIFDSNSNLCLKGKTMAFFTHDFATMIPLIKLPSGSLNHIAKGFIVQNEKGHVSTSPITKTDIQNSLIIEEEKAKDTTLPMLLRVVHLRRYYELKSVDSNEYEYLSCLTHNDDDHEKPVKKTRFDTYTEFTSDEIIKAEANISSFLGQGNFKFWSAETKNVEKLMSAYEDAKSKYEKLCLARSIIGSRKSANNDVLWHFITETYHIEQEQIFGYKFDDGTEIPGYIISICDELVGKIKLEH
jgi:energy-coupling factor transporter ATP-binding protein EcfA2